MTQGDRRPLAAIVVAATCVVVGLAACSPSAQPSPSPTTTVGSHPTPTSTPSPTPTAPQAPVLPDQVESEDGAVAMMRYVLQAYTYAFATNDAAPLDSVAGEKCTFCEHVRDDVATNRAADRKVRGGALNVLDAHAVRLGEDGMYGGDLTMVELESQLIDATGAVVSHNPERRYAVNFTIQWNGSRWIVRDVGAKPLSEK